VNRQLRNSNESASINIGIVIGMVYLCTQSRMTGDGKRKPSEPTRTRKRAVAAAAAADNSNDNNNDNNTRYY